jgi:Calcineurin-like phosphoesterase
VSKRILVLPDVQAKPGIDFSYLMRIGQYMVDKKPDIVVCIGDFADMPSLSSYDKGKKSFEGRRYKRDVQASLEAMSAFLTPMTDYNARAKRNKEKSYKPQMVLTLGNHEDRINRAINDDPKLDGVLSINDLQYQDFGWEVVPFLEVKVLEGVAFSHYFVTGLMGRPVTTAQACLTKKHMSCVQGHQQGLQIATGYRGDGQLLTSIIAGSCYEHDEDYMSSQGNKHWRGFLMLHDVCDGVFDLMPVSLSYVNKRYPDLHVAKDHAKEHYPEGMR